MRCDGNVCECVDDYHLRFHNWWVECREGEESDSGMYLMEGTDAYADEQACTRNDVFAMYTMNDSSTLLCVARQKCVDKGGFLYNK